MHVMDAKLNTRMPSHLMGAIKIAARRRRLGFSAYVRQTVLAQLIVEGVVSREDIDAVSDPAVAPTEADDLAPGQWRYEWLRERGLV